MPLKTIINSFLFFGAVFLSVESFCTEAFAKETEKRSSEEKKQHDLEQMFDTKYSEEDYYHTDRVLLSATKSLVESRKAPAINMVITADEIRNMGARNVSDVLDKIPGLSTPWNQLKELVDIRGVHTDHAEKVLLLVDGVRIRDSYTGSPTYLFGEDMLVENIKRIEVVRGPGSALFGANAFVGVINIITKNPDDYSDHVMASTSFGSFYTQEHMLYLSKNSGDFKVSGHVNFFDTDGQQPIIKEDALSNSTTLNASASLAPGKAPTYDRKIDSGIKFTWNDFTLSGRYIDKKRGGYVGPTGVLPPDDGYLAASMGLVDLQYKRHLTDNLSLIAKSYFIHIESDANAVIYPPGFHPVIDDNGMIGRPMFKNMVIGAELSASYTLGSHLLTSGAVYEADRQYDVRHFDNFSNGEFGDPVETTDINNFNKNVTRQIWAVFLQEMWEITAYDSLTLGVRYDHYSDFGGTVNPRAGYVHEFKNGIIVKALYGRAFRAPNNNELYSKFGVLGNPKLKPEKIWTAETSLSVPFLKYYSIGVNYFHNEIGNLIRLDTSTGIAPYSFTNVSKKSKIDGVESEFLCNFGKNRYGYANVSFQHSKDSEGRVLPYVANWMGNVGYNHQFFGILNTNINVYWTGRRTRLAGDTRSKAPAAALVDMTLIARNFYRTLEIKGSVFNVFGENYVDPSTISNVTYDLPRHGRMFLVELRYSF